MCTFWAVQFLKLWNLPGHHHAHFLFHIHSHVVLALLTATTKTLALQRYGITERNVVWSILSVFEQGGFGATVSDIFRFSFCKALESKRCDYACGIFLLSSLSFTVAFLAKFRGWGWGKRIVTPSTNLFLLGDPSRFLSIPSAHAIVWGWADFLLVLTKFLYQRFSPSLFST